ncbi:MAG: CAP domain-containing protein [Rhodospirillaceae bacterium]|nr:CAP domain-containing protein [Rhodospirillaceae bacterium]
MTPRPVLARPALRLLTAFAAGALGIAAAIPPANAANRALLPGLLRPAPDTGPDRSYTLVRSRYVRAKPRLRTEEAPRGNSRRGQPGPSIDRLACKAWKYHGADQIPRPYDPDRYVYSEEYKRGPDRPGREEAAQQADAAFPQLIDAKVLRMLQLINQVRERRGHTTMKLEPRLMVAAKRHNLDIARHALMQHTGTDCSQLGDRVWDEGYTWRRIAENLAGGRATAEATMEQWTGSTRHLMQMTLTGMTEVGIAYDYTPTPPRHGIPIKHFWTLIMAGPDPWRDRLWPKKPAPCAGEHCPEAAKEPAGAAKTEEPAGNAGKAEGPIDLRGGATRTQ